MSNSPVEILLVEDNVHDAEMTIRALTKNKIIKNILHLEDGEEALQFLFRTGQYAERDILQTPKLILLDLKMPKVSGMELLGKIKSDERTRKIPVVVLTSSNEDPDIQKCYDLGANAYVVKPVSFDEFYNAISNLGLFWLITNQPPH